LQTNGSLRRSSSASITELNSVPAPLAAQPGSAGLSFAEDGSTVCDHTSYTLRQARLRVEELTRANRRKDEFLAVLGHELRNPLASIRNAVHLLRYQVQDTPECQRTHALIERQIHRMTQLVDDLLDVSRVTHGRLYLHCERVDLREVVNNAIETLDSDIHQRNHRLTTTLPDAPVWLQADPIAPEVLPHIFELFRQADQAAVRSQSGLGIGLALVRNLVESHGGSVIAASAGVGRGSEFTVRLPQEG
jgi:signal transduction histidine kinase